MKSETLKKILKSVTNEEMPQFSLSFNFQVRSSLFAV